MSHLDALQKFAGDGQQIVPVGNSWQIVPKADTAPAAKAKTTLTPEELEAKLSYINEMVPHRTQLLMGSQAGAGSGDFHQYRSSRRREQSRLARLDADEKSREEEAEFEARKRQREDFAAARTAKRAKKRQKKKGKKRGGAGGGGGVGGGSGGGAGGGGGGAGGSSSEEESSDEEGRERGPFAKPAVVAAKDLD